MKTIKRRLFLYAGVCALMAAAAIVFFIRTADHGQTGLLWLPFFAIAVLSAASLTAKEVGRLRTARLIADNQIMYIRSATYEIQHNGQRGDRQPQNSSEAYVSCFGILLDAKIIKFNQDGIQLNAMKIGKGSLSFEYGTGMSNHNVTLFYNASDAAGSEDVAERFRYETGIVPSIKQEGGSVL